MSISEPEIRLSKPDKELLALMARLILEDAAGEFAANRSPAVVRLSDAEARKLLSLLTQFVESRKFVEGSYFVEGLTNPNELREDRLREIYLSARKRNGRTRTMSSMRWAEFLARLGVDNSPYSYANPDPMTFDRFLALERRLYAAAGVHPDVAELLLAVLTSSRSQIEGARHRENSIQHGVVRSAIIQPFRSLLQSVNSRISDPRLTTTQVSAAMILVSDLSVMFTTRDWDVVSTLSAWGGAFASLTHNAGGSAP